MRLHRPIAFAALLAIVTVSCGSDAPPVATDAPAVETSGTSETSETSGPIAVATTITLVAYSSFPERDTSLNDALDEFTADTGIGVRLLIAGDAGTMLAKASLTAGNPEGDVIWGIDNTLLSRAIADGIFEPYPGAPTDSIPSVFTELTQNSEAVPVDFGDVCVNYDIGFFDRAGLAVPDSLQALVAPEYADLLVVQNPATSSPGLAFLLATVDEFGVDGWQTYWRELVGNGVQVVDSWTDAYYGSFSWAGGDRPLVVSYGSSPPAEVIFADPPRTDAPTGVIESTCFRQVEFAGVLAGTKHPGEARMLIDFLVGATFQSELALNLFVYPVNDSVALPQEFIDYASVPSSSRSVDPAFLDVNRSIWIDQWTEIVLG